MYVCILTYMHIYKSELSDKIKLNFFQGAVVSILLVIWVLWHINLCRLFNTKSIFIQIISSISNNAEFYKMLCYILFVK